MPSKAASRKKVLVISYAFPPTGGAGVQRTVKFVKFMRKYGYEPVVLTVENRSVPLEDDSLSKDIPAGTAILTSRTLEPSYKVKDYILKEDKKKKSFKRHIERAIRNILIPDPQVLWFPGVIKRLLSLRKERFDLIFVTAPPFSALVLGVLAKFMLGRPLVSDFRDEWVGFLAGSSWSGAGGGKRASYAIERFLERLVLKRSDAVIAASPGYIKSFSKKYGRIADKALCITNGYDPADFDFDDPEGDFQSILAKDKFNVVYMGTVWPATSLTYFLEGVKMMRSKDDINIIILGRITSQEEAAIDAFKGLNIRKLGYYHHEKAVKLASRADALLVTLSPIEGAERIIPGKIFECMAMRRRIIAVVPDGSTSEILEGYSGSTIVSPADAVRIAEKCQSLLEAWKKGGLKAVDDDLEKYTRDVKTRALCSVFDRILSGRAAKAVPANAARLAEKEEA